MRTKTRVKKRCSISCFPSFWLVSICVLNCAVFLNFFFDLKGEGVNAMARELKVGDGLEPFLFSDILFYGCKLFKPMLLFRTIR